MYIALRRLLQLASHEQPDGEYQTLPIQQFLSGATIHEVSDIVFKQYRLSVEDPMSGNSMPVSYTFSPLFALYVSNYFLEVIPSPIPYNLNATSEHFTAPAPSMELDCPSVRSKSDIMWSCVVTIFACCWVSVHPNIPCRGKGWFQLMLRRLDLMFWSIIAPEFVVGWAMRQWYGARVLENKYQGTFLIHL